MSKKYSELLKELELTADEKKTLEDLKNIPRYHISWPKGYEALISPVGRAHAKLAITECLKEAKELSETDPDEVSIISLRNAWFFSFDLFNSKDLWSYSHQMNNDLFMGAGKEELKQSFNSFISNLFGDPTPFKWNGFDGWIWSNIIIDF